jgi:hypothetical protein
MSGSFTARPPRSVVRRGPDASLRGSGRGSGSDGVDGAGTLDRLTRYLEQLAADGFFGKVTVSFQNGRACDVKIEQTHKLDEL